MLQRAIDNQALVVRTYRSMAPDETLHACETARTSHTGSRATYWRLLMTGPQTALDRCIA